MKDNQIILHASGLTKCYLIGQARQQVLNGVDLQVKSGEFLAIMGASGSGKSTLLHILGLLDRPDNGTVQFNGQNVSKLKSKQQNYLRNREFGFVFQFYHLLPELNVRENVTLPLMISSPMGKWSAIRQASKERVDHLLESVGLLDRAGQMPNTLSGGERQRIALARALVCQPRVLLADEPTGNLDSKSGSVILEILLQLNQAGQSIVMVTHDPGVAEKGHRTVHLKDGKIV